MITIVFDMDGTVADLYGRENWLKEIRNEELDFSTLKPLVNMDAIEKDIKEKSYSGEIKFVIITWSPMNCSQEYHLKVSRQKQEWVERHMPYISEFYCLPYGVPKQDAPIRRTEKMYLLDDNSEVIEMWRTEEQKMGVLVSDVYDVNEAVYDILIGL